MQPRDPPDQEGHPGKDAGSGHARGATLATAGVPDVCETHGLVRDDDEFCYADATWRGVARREEVRSDPHLSGTGWRVAPDPPSLGPPGATGAERCGAEASVRARASVPARSLDAPSATRRCTTAASRKGRVCIPALFASANLPACARAGRQEEFLGASVVAA